MFLPTAYEQNKHLEEVFRFHLFVLKWRSFEFSLIISGPYVTLGGQKIDGKLKKFQFFNHKSQSFKISQT